MKVLHTSSRRMFVYLLAAIVALSVVSPLFADEVTGSAAVTGGSLIMSAVDNPTFAATTLDGTNQTQSDSIDIDVKDLTGSGSGWNLTVTSTTFSDGTHSLANTALSITGVSTVCDSGSCTNPTNSIGYPLTVPADATAPAAVKLFNAAVDSGMGDFTVTPTLELSIPAATYAGTYTSTLTLTVASAP